MRSEWTRAVSMGEPKLAQIRIAKDVNVPPHPFSDGDAQTVLLTVPRLPRGVLIEALQAMPLGSPQKDNPLADALAKWSQWKVEDLAAIFTALEDRTSAEAMAPVRLTALGKHLERCIIDSKPWHLKDVQLLAGGLGLDPHLSSLGHMSKVHANDVLVPQRAAPDLTWVKGFTWKNPVMDAARWAIAAHCRPLLEVLATTVRMAPQHGATCRGTGLSLDLAVRQGGDDDVSFCWDADRFKETFEFLVENGHNPLDQNSYGRNLVHELAEHSYSKPVEKRALKDNPGQSRVFDNVALMKSIDQKLMLLLDHGVDAFAEDDYGNTPVSLLRNVGEPAIAHRFELVARTYKTRGVALQVLMDIEQESPAP